MSDCAWIRVDQFALNRSKYAVFDSDMSSTNLDKLRVVSLTLCIAKTILLARFNLHDNNLLRYVQRARKCLENFI
jgi:hypothetical protein